MILSDARSENLEVTAWRKLHRLWASDRLGIAIITHGMSWFSWDELNDFAEQTPFRNTVVATVAIRPPAMGGDSGAARWSIVDEQRQSDQ
jgi:hypothetical protein